MKLQLFINNSEDNKIYKNIDYINEVNGILRYPASLLNPVIDIELSNYNELESVIDVVYPENLIPYVETDITYQDDDEDFEVDTYSDNRKIFDINYIYIDEFDRYYYVDNIDFISNKLYRLSLSVDVLRSHADKFMNLEAVIERASRQYDDALEDNIRPFKYKNEIYKCNLTSYRIFNPYLKNGMVYSITYLDQKGTAYGTSEIISPVSYLPNISYQCSGFSAPYRVAFTNDETVTRLLNHLLDNSSDATFVNSIIAYPYNIPVNFYTNQQLYLNKTKINGGYVLYGEGDNGPLSPYIEIGSFKPEVMLDDYLTNSYLDYSPYTRYELYIPYYGFIELDYNDIKDSVIKIFMIINYQIGEAKINICNDSKKYVIKSVTAVFGVKIPINRTNSQELDDQKTQMMIKTAISTLGSLISIGGGMASGNAFLTASGVTGLIGTAGDVAGKLATMHDTGQIDSTSGFNGLYGEQYPYMKITKMISNEPTNYEKYYGKPVNKTLTFTTFYPNDFVKVADIHLENVDILSGEKELLIALLKNGVII